MDSAIVSKVWNFANVLRDDGVGYGDYLEQSPICFSLKWRMNSTNRLTTKSAEIIERDKTNLDIFWIKDQSLTDLDNLPRPGCFGKRNN